MESRGLWAVSDNTAGGPFLSYTLVDEENQIVVIDPSRRLEPGIYIITGSVDNSWYNKKLVVK